MTLPLQILFWIDSQSLRAGTYRSIISHHHALLQQTNSTPWAGLPRPLAYISCLTEADKIALPDCIDCCYDHDIAIHVRDDAQIQERGITEMLHVLDRRELQSTPYALLLKGDARIQPSSATLSQILLAAANLLHSNHHVVTVGFPNTFGLVSTQPISETFILAPSVRWPAVARTRDLYLAALFARDREEHALSAMSPLSIRHLQFNARVAATI